MEPADSSPIAQIKLSTGKRVGLHLYLHVLYLDLLPEDALKKVRHAIGLTGIQPGLEFNVVKFHVNGTEVSLLNYPEFLDDPFPELACSWRVAIKEQSVSVRDYKMSWNPPVLHRKELLLDSSHPRYREYAATTAEAEAIGLFSEPNKIGFRQQWQSEIEQHGYFLEGGKFIPKANASSATVDVLSDSEGEIRRHLTALSRTTLSAPMKALLRHNLLNENSTFFDYGCGRGDDLRAARELNIPASGWDPHYAPSEVKSCADVVNIGFVINVIEDPRERADALIGAYTLCTRVLSVAAMLAHLGNPEGKPFGDGFVTKRGTFQKYFSQSQLRDYIEHTLDAEAVACGPGVFLVFRDKALEQSFLRGRLRSSRSVVVRYRKPVMDAQRSRAPRASADFLRLQSHPEVFRAISCLALHLGREPAEDEANKELVVDAIEAFGSFRRAVRVALKYGDEAALERMRNERISELLVLLATQVFQRRSTFRQLTPSVQRDIRAFFGDYATAHAAAREILFSVADSSVLLSACKQACADAIGWLHAEESLQLHVSLISRLPAVLRAYIACATALSGDVSEFDLVKIHILSGKLTLLRFEDFLGTPLPRLLERVKVRLRDTDIDYFLYGAEHPPTLLYRKSRFMNEESERYGEQVAFEEALEALSAFELDGYGPSESEFRKTLHDLRWDIDGFELVPLKQLPGLDEPCGAYLSYRDLVECGETQTSLGIPNLPLEPATYTALRRLAKDVLDPVIDYFGMIRLTFGFCSQTLSKHLKTRIAPKLDQHAGHELNGAGNPICPRLGMACDFIIDDEDMWEVAQWISQNTRFDRLYFYGRDRPIHVSCAPTQAGQVVKMTLSRSGKLIPRVVTSDALK